MNPITVAFFGISGSGKGTQADMLEKFLNREDPKRSVARAEMGALARAFMKTGTPLAKRTEEIVSSGGLLPSFIPIYLLVEVLKFHRRRAPDIGRPLPKAVPIDGRR